MRLKADNVHKQQGKILNSKRDEYKMRVPLKEWVDRPQHKGLTRQRNDGWESKFSNWEMSIKDLSGSIDYEILNDILETNPTKQIPKVNKIKHNKYTKRNYYAPKNNRQFNHRRR